MNNSLNDPNISDSESFPSLPERPHKLEDIMLEANVAVKRATVFRKLAEEHIQLRDDNAKLLKQLAAALSQVDSAFWDGFNKGKAEAEEELKTLRRIPNGEVWYWQGDGTDVPESLTCPVIMSAEALHALLAIGTQAETNSKGAQK